MLIIFKGSVHALLLGLVIKMVEKVLRQDGDGDFAVVGLKYGLWAIKNLASRSSVNRARLGELGACQKGNK